MKKQTTKKSQDKRRFTLILEPENFKNYTDSFNKNDTGRTAGYIDNKEAWSWLEKNIPFFESSDKTLEEIYYFRWWAYRKHIHKTPDGFIVAEPLSGMPGEEKPDTNSLAAGHHIYEGRWLRDYRYMRDYALHWFKHDGEPRRNSFWAADAILAWSQATLEQHTLIFELLPELVSNYRELEKSSQDVNGLFLQSAEKDGMKEAVSGDGFRPSFNSYMYGEAAAISEIAGWAWNNEQASEFAEKAKNLRKLIDNELWDEAAGFYKTAPSNCQKGQALPLTINQLQAWVNARELAGYAPWYFNLPKQGHEAAWKLLMDPNGFYSKNGPLTLERRNPKFVKDAGGWDGSSRPYATSLVLTAMANLLNNYKQNYVSKDAYMEILGNYARSQYKCRADGKKVPFIGEYLNPDTGEWGFSSASQADCNQSTFADLIITGLAGLRPRSDQVVELNPMAAESTMEYFCLDGIRYHDVDLTILWDKTGKRYKKGKGLRVFADGQEIGAMSGLQWMTAVLPGTSAGWKKYENNPVIGGGRPTREVVGTVFDIEVMQEDGKYRMWASWRPKQSIVLFEGTDGIHWSPPEIVLSPNPANDWEGDISRPSVVKREDGYHMWYTAWPAGDPITGCHDTAENGWHSWIGYATSSDGRTWKRMSDRPVFVPEEPWEAPSVMCPNVLWDDEEKLYKMWYSGGQTGWEPDAIGYATSPDGINWTRLPEPVFTPEPENFWEHDKVCAAQVLRWGKWYYMVYMGMRDTSHAQIGLARSLDGITNWQRHPGNPIIRQGQDSWDQESCYKPLMRFDGQKWLLWYNGRNCHLERIGLVMHEGEDLGFE